MNGGLSQQARVMENLGLYADKLPPREPTLTEAIDALKLAIENERRADAAWTGPSDTRDLEAWKAKNAAADRVQAALVKLGVSDVDAENMKDALL